MDNFDQIYQQMFNNNVPQQINQVNQTKPTEQEINNVQFLSPEMFEEQPEDILRNYMGQFRRNDNSMRIMKVISADVEDSWN
jgi:hypothetical protein